MSKKKVFDANLMFSNGVSMATGFGTADSPVASSVIDTGAADGDSFNPAEVQVIVDGGDSVSDTGTIQPTLQDSADGTTGWATIVSGKISGGNGAGYSGPYRFGVPTEHRRYLRLSYLIATNNFTAGTLHAGLVQG